jgi:hypothetical protein
MRIVLLGPEDCGKKAFAKSLKRRYSSLSIAPGPEDFFNKLFVKEDKIPALGYLSDYRSELLLATYRACEMVKNDNTIYTHSVLDNFIYAMSISSFRISHETIDDQWIECFRWFPYLIQDSFMSDIVVKFEKEDDGELSELFSKNIDFILDLYSVDSIDSTDTKAVYKILDSKLGRTNESTNSGTGKKKLS